MTKDLDRIETQQQLVKRISEDERRNANLIRRSRTIIQKLFPTELQQVIDTHELTQAQSELEFREKALKIVKEAQLQGIQEVFNHFLEKSKTNLRKEKIEFFLIEYNHLQDAVNIECEEFTNRIIDEWKRIESIPIRSLKNKESERLNKMILNFHAAVDRLMAEFVAIPNERIIA